MGSSANWKLLNSFSEVLLNATPRALEDDDRIQALNCWFGEHHRFTNPRCHIQRTEVAG